MFYWGSGTSLGLLTGLGYLAFLAGAIYSWRHRDEFSLWLQAEVSLFRRNLSRYVPSGSFYERRGESRLIVIPSSFVQSVAQLPRRRFSWGGFLIFLGLLLFALDFFI